MKKFLLIDTFNFLHRAYHALPQTLTDTEGNPVNAIYGVTSMLISVFDAVKPDYVVAALDGKKPTFRVEEFTGYKAHRRPMEEGLSAQIPKAFEVLDAFGINKIVVDGYEADDVIGTLDKKFGSKDVQVVIVSNDKDLWQLVDDHTIIMVPGNGKKPTEWLDCKAVQEKLGFNSNLLVDYKGLRGDPSDNIPGVYGIGDKTALRLITQFGTIAEIYKHIDSITPESLQKKLAACAETAVMSKHLAEIITDIPLKVSLEECKYSEFNKGAVRNVLQKYNFKSLLKRLGFEDSYKKVPEVSSDQLALFRELETERAEEVTPSKGQGDL